MHRIQSYEHKDVNDKNQRSYIPIPLCSSTGYSLRWRWRIYCLLLQIAAYCRACCAELQYVAVCRTLLTSCAAIEQHISIAARLVPASRLAALSEEQGSADSSALPEIKAALDSGHSHESVCECLPPAGTKSPAKMPIKVLLVPDVLAAAHFPREL